MAEKKNTATNTQNTHKCDYGINDSATYHNFTHLIVDQLDKSRGLITLWQKFTPEEKIAVRAGINEAVVKYVGIRQTHLDFICFFDNQQKQPVELYENAHLSLKLASDRLAKFTTAKLFLDQWDLGLTYDWKDADDIIGKTRFLKAAAPTSR
jgi:hypothetical protein